MSYTNDIFDRTGQDAILHQHKQQLEEHVAVLTEWKRKATLQLEYFRDACVIYKLCDVDKVNELLNR